MLYGNMTRIKLFSIIRFFLLMGAIALTISLLFFQKQKTTSDENILFVVSVSNSMNARDILSAGTWISRLDATKKIITQIVNDDSSANYGLVLFSQVAHRFVPLTHDTWTFLNYLDAINTSILSWWTSDRSSLQKIFSWATVHYSKIIFFSDAEISWNLYIPKHIQDSKNYFIGLGTENDSWVRYSNGSIVRDKWIKVRSSYDINNARSLSHDLHAKLFSLDTVDHVDTLIQEIIDSYPRISFVQVQIFVIFLWLFILLIL